MWQWIIGGTVAAAAGYQVKKVLDKRPRKGDIVTVPVAAISTLNGIPLPRGLPDVTATVVSLDANNTVIGNVTNLGEIQFRILAIKTLMRDGKTIAL